MNNRFFIEDQKLVTKVLPLLTCSDEKEEWCKKYLDMKTGQTWEKYEFDFGGFEDGIGLRKFPYPNTTELIEIVLNSPYLDEVNGASGLLSEQDECDGLDFRLRLLDEIESIKNEIDPERFDIIFNRAMLYDKTNNRGVLGKSMNQITKDAQYYSEMAERALKLKAQIQGPAKS